MGDAADPSGSDENPRRQVLVTVPVGAVIHRLARVTSTNDVARDLARDGAPHGTAVVAEEQTSGRGTKGRVWHSPPGLGLYASFILRFPDLGPASAFHFLPLAAGLAAADAVWEAAGIEARLKWPNDLVLGRRKLGGILAESVSTGSSPGFAVVGVGINVGHGERDFPEGLRQSSTSLCLAGGRPADKEGVFAALCRTLDNWYNSLIRGEKDAIARAFGDRAAFSPGDPVRVTTGAGSFPGTYRGLDAEGRLLAERRGRTETVSVDDIRDLDWV